MNDEIKIGDYVKVIELPTSHNEFVEAIGINYDGDKVYCCTDGKFYTEFEIVKFKVQGVERLNLLDKLNETL